MNEVFLEERNPYQFLKNNSEFIKQKVHGLEEIYKTERTICPTALDTKWRVQLSWVRQVVCWVSRARRLIAVFSPAVFLPLFPKTVFQTTLKSSTNVLEMS